MSDSLPVDKPVEATRKIGRHGTKNEAVTTLLSEYITHRKQVKILDLFRTIDFDRTYDYKAERRRKDSVNRPSGSSE
jgi:hypothetical protein